VVSERMRSLLPGFAALPGTSDRTAQGLITSNLCENAFAVKAVLAPRGNDGSCNPSVGHHRHR